MAQFKFVPYISASFQSFATKLDSFANWLIYEAEKANGQKYNFSLL